MNLKYDIRQVYDWPMVPRFIVIGVICLIFFSFCYWADISRLRSKIRVEKQKEEDYKTQFVSLVENTRDLGGKLSIYTTLENALKEAKKKLISPEELPELLNDILKIGSQNELKFSNFTPGVEEKAGAYQKVVIKAVIVGTYDQIASFISQVANMEKTVSVGNFTLSRKPLDKLTEDQGVLSNHLTADLTLEVYEAKLP